jgi:hypothetical protein
MSKLDWKKPAARIALACILIVSNVLFGIPADFLAERWNESKIVDTLYHSMKDDTVIDEGKRRIQLPALTKTAHAANFSIQTGYYVGNGGTNSVTGLGFQPETVIVKTHTTTGTAVIKTSAMPANSTAFFLNTANDTSSMVTLGSDGFSVSNNANVNTANVRYLWVAFAGSDCTASGTMCVGTYTGNGANPRKITTGFQPAFVMVKRSTAVAANFRTASMANNVGNYFHNTAQVTNGGLFATLVSDGFNVGSAVNNVNTGIYYYVAFKSVSGIMAQGTYSGNGTDNRSITGFGSGSVPNFAFVKNVTSATTATRNAAITTTDSYGDHSSYLTVTTASAPNMIQKLQDNGIQVGSGVNANENGATIYWVAFGGAPASPPPGNGTFQMETGSYTGNGTSQSITGTGFAPDLVILKGSSTSQSVFRTSLMAANNTAYLASATANFTGGITALGSDGFSVGSNAAANSSGVVYHWQAFGNAYNTSTGTGAEDFAIGAYMGNAADNRDIPGLPFQPDMVTVKRSGATAGTWRPSAYGGDSSSFFAATAEGANRIQSLNTFGYQIGTQANVNTSNNLYHWFAFKSGDNFTVGSYTGTGGAQTVNTGFQPDLVWVKRNTSQVGVHRGSSLAGNSTQHFGATANFTNGITGFTASGFSLAGTTAMTNANTGVYRYAAWRVPPPPVATFDIVDSSGDSVSSPGVILPESNFSFGCTNTLGTLGTNDQRLRITSPAGAGPQWSLSIAATDGSAALWRNGGNTEQFDFNDISGSPPGCDDGVTDGDTKAGLLSFDPTQGVNTPQPGCTDDNIEFANAGNFQQGLFDSVNLISASAGASTGCYWDITNIGVSQYIPGGQRGNDTYNINLTLTITAF